MRATAKRAAGWSLLVAAATAAACGDGSGSSSDSRSATTTPPNTTTDGGVLPDGATATPPGSDGGGEDGDAAVADPPASDIPDAGPIVAPQKVSANIVVDQFGYLPVSEKIAVLRSPQTGFDASAKYTPAAKYALVDAHSGAHVLEAAPAAWNGGATDGSSGYKAWWFDFSSVTTPGDYFVLDTTADVRSEVLRISKDVYRDVLVAAVRMLYYQRDGIAKDARYAGADYADAMAHPQGARCGLYSNGSGSKDLHGGWFDAGDQNKYTNWAADYVIELLHAYVEAPAAFGDATNIPESGNGVPDLLDEVKWEIDWIARMQNPDGGVLSVVGQGGTSPPSLDTSPCKYGPATTSASLSTAAALAYASIVFRSVSAVGAAYPGYADSLAAMAKKAWTWAGSNTNVTFYNAQNGVAAGEQEVDDSGRLDKKVQAAAYLFELTGDATYKSIVDANYQGRLQNFDPFHVAQLDTLLDYAKTLGATSSIASTIMSTYKSDIEGGSYFGKEKSAADPYLAYLDPYTWGSNQVKAWQGTMFTNVGAFHVDDANAADATRFAARYAHYLHGVNPLGMVYLSNMQAAGGEKGVTRFYHSWFGHGTDWDAAGVSKHAPPPGYLVGGPNPSYSWDGCCPSGCGSAQNNAMCGSASPSPPGGQPPQKAYKDFNDGWPLDSWSITEPDDGYQAKYIRLLAKFVP